MTEREMRQIVTRLLRRTVRTVILPASLGVGLALAGCDSGRTVTPDELFDSGVVPPVKKTEAGLPGPVYAAPYPEPDSGSWWPEYAAPFPKHDAGQNNALYSAPFPAPEAGQAQPDYAAPFPEPDGGEPPDPSLYAAPFP